MDITYVKAVFGSLRKTRTQPVYRDDHDLILQLVGVKGLPVHFQAHFSNTEYGTAVVMMGSDGEVSIPNTLLATGLPVYCWILVEQGISGAVRYSVQIPVRQKARPDGTITPEQADIISQAISALNDAGANAQEAADSAQQSAEEAAQSALDALSDAQTASNVRTYVSEQAGIIAATRDYVEQNVAGFDNKVSAAISDIEEAGAVQKNLAKAQAENSEAWAVGKKNGVDVASTDEAYHNNAKWYAEQAAESARTLTIDNTLSQSGQAADAKKTGDAIGSVKSDLKNVSQTVMIDKNVAITAWYQGSISPTNGSNQSGVKTVRTDFIYVEDTYLNVIVPDGYVIRVMVYAIRTITSYTGTYTEFSSVDFDISAYRGKYIKLNLKYNVDAEITPSDVSGVGISYQTFTDTSLTVPGKAPDSKVVGDGFKAINDVVGKLTTADFVKPESGNAIKVFAYPVQANKKISFYWSGENVQSNDSINLYSRAAASGQNAETLKATAKANTLYEVTPTVDANYLRVVATNSGTISVYDSDTLLSDISALKSNVEKHDKLLQKTPFVRFGFNDILYDPSDIFGENGEIGDINSWESKAEALSKVHAAFDALCSSGGVGYGYGERITGLYKESAEDESLVDVIAPSYVTSGASEGDTVILPIGTDSNGDPVTYAYTYESNTEPYEVRLYRFRDTNNALHTATVDIPKKKILLVGGTHGNEFCAPINLYVLAKNLCSDYSNPDVLKLRSAFDIYIVPYLNGFGCQYQWSNNGVLTTGARCNGRMVDINRNCYTAGWVGETGTSEQITTKFESKISNLATNTFAGSGNGSEFESQLIKGLLELIKPDVFIDHHHNSGNSPFYTTCRGNEAGNIIYQAANDSAYARLHNMPEYFGTKYNLFLGSDVSPATKSAANGHMETMAYELGISMNAVSEMPESIAYLNGVIDSGTKAATKYSALAFKQAEYTLLNLALHMCQWAMEH